MNDNKKCPCKSGFIYKECCEPYHKGKKPEDASILMRSRFSAYALGLADYIIATTDEESSRYDEDKEDWKRNIKAFREANKFENLEIIDFKEVDDVAFVIFIVTLNRQGKEIVYTERSCFLLKDGTWLFRDSLIEQGKKSVKEMENL